ncbi:RHS domain-containing protein, partial [Pseudomonas sp. PDM16]
LMQPEEAQRQEVRLKQTTWSEDEWSAYVQANLDNPDFNPLLTPAEAQADPSTWGENKPNRLRVWEEHRYAYDAWGNCIEKKSGPHTERQFQWDAEHQLSRVTVTRRQGHFTHTEHWGYDYDPFGRRIAKYRLDPHNEKRSRPWLDNETTHYGWDGNRLLLERQGDRQQLYIYEPRSFVPLAMVRSEGAQTETQGLPLEYQALKEQAPEQWADMLDKLPRKIAAAIRQLERPKKPNKIPAEILYYHTDHLGTPRELTDKDGHIVWSATYKAWGNTAKIEQPGRLITGTQGSAQIQRWEEQENPVEQRLRFQGQYYDQETGLHYNRFRYYDPDIGRFISQ